MSQISSKGRPEGETLATLVSLLTGQQVKVRSTTEHPCSSYGIPVWVDDNNISYGQVGLPMLGWRVAWQGRAS